MSAADASKRSREHLILSPSQLSNHAVCARKWYYQSVEKRFVPQHPGAVAGSHAHTQCELRAEGKEYERLPHVEAVGRYDHPPLALGVERELKIKMAVAGVRMTGRLDGINASGRYVDSIGNWRESPGIPEVFDYKFTSSRYWLTSSRLRDDLQLNVYGLWVLTERFKQADMVRLSHIYGSRTAPFDAAKVTTLRPRQEIEKWRASTLEPAIDGLLVTAACEDVSQTRVNLNGCSAFGGCPFSGFCTKRQSSGEIESDLYASLFLMNEKTATTKSVVENQESDMADLFESMLLNRVNQTPANPRPEPPKEDKPAPKAQVAAEKSAAEKPAVAEAPKAESKPAVALVADAGVDLFADMFGGGKSANGASKAKAAPAPKPEPKVEAKAEVEEIVQEIVQAIEASSIEMPEALAKALIEKIEVEQMAEAKAEPAPAPVEPPPAVEPSPELGTVETKPAPEATPPPAVASEPTPISPPAEEVKRGRGRPKKDGTPAVAKATREDDQTADGTPEPESIYGTEMMLYIDCQPSRPARNLEAYIGEICGKLAAEYALPDIRCAVGESPLSFGKWKGVLAARVRKSPPPAGRWFVVGAKLDDLKMSVATAIGMLPETVDVVYGF